MKNITAENIACPRCGGQDVQLDGIQSIRVIEDWTDGRRWNYEYPAEPTGKWLSLSAHCLSCDHEWEILPDPGELSPRVGEDLTHASELLPCAGEEKPTEEARKAVLRALADILQARRLGYDTCPWLNWIGPGPFGDVRVVESEEIHMNLHAMPLDLATAICQTIRDYQNARGWPPGPRSNPGKAW